ncbi:MAG: extracellular solute-binding protein [Tyzzerella sp.]|nr:extracellular solute-binding protein [Tyzzerella sp.]
MMRKKLLAGVLAVTLACSALVGCGGSGGSEQSSGENSNGKIELSLWSTYTTESTTKFNELVAKFNAENENYEVKVEAGLGEDQTRQKLTTVDKEFFPAMFMGTDSSIFEYSDASYVQPVQNFLNEDNEDWLAGMLDSVKTAYSDKDGNLVGMPIGVSVKGYMVNLDVLAQTGYTLDDLTSFEKVAAAATAAKDKGASQYGYVPSSGVEIMDMLLYQGVDIFDGDNGHSGEITKCMYTEGETLEALKKMAEIYADMFKSGVAVENSSGPDSYASVFTSGKTLFWSCTSSYVYEFENVNVNFEWAFMPFKGVDDNAEHQNTVMPEGTGIFIANSGDEKKMQGAYEFIKFLARPENQLFWSTFRGYTPYTEEALSSQEWITWRDENYPSEAKIEEMLKAGNEALHFPNTSIIGKLGNTNTQIISSIIENPDADLEEIIKTATENINQSIKILQLRGQ